MAGRVAAGNGEFGASGVPPAGGVFKCSSGLRISDYLYFITCAAKVTPVANCPCARFDMARLSNWDSTDAVPVAFVSFASNEEEALGINLDGLRGALVVARSW
jgi:hypothetical protein